MADYIFNPGYTKEKVVSNKALYLMALSHIGFYVIPNVIHGEKIKTWAVDKDRLTDADDPRWLEATFICPSSLKLTNSSFLFILKECGFSSVEVIPGMDNQYIIDLRPFQYEEDSIVEDYKWLFDTIWVYVANTYDGGGWDTEIPVVNNSISDSIKAYKKTLGKGYWVEYIRPGKMHKNNNITEDIELAPVVYNSGGIKAYLLPTDNEKAMEFLKQFNMNAEFKPEPEFYHIFVDIGKDKGYIIEVDRAENLLSEIILATPSNFEYLGIGGLAKLLILEPSLFNILDERNIDIPNYSTKSPYQIASEFRNKFKGNDYNEAVWLLQKSIELGKEEDPWGLDPEVEDSIADQIINDPVGFIEGLNYDIGQLSRDGNDELVQLAVSIKEKAENLLFPDSIIENKIN